jgi:hypothetical protein
MVATLWRVIAFGYVRRVSSTFLLLGVSAFLFVTPVHALEDKPSQLSSFNVDQKDGQILSYRYLGASTEVTMRGTSRAPDARIKLKVGSRPGFVEIDINRGQITGLKPASQFGTDFLTYVLWAVSVDGKAANLGEITFLENKPISINVTTPYQTFWLMLTAEPNYAVVDPSPLVVLYSCNENPEKPSAERTAQEIRGTPLFFYTHYSDYDTKPMSSNRAPNALLQARKAVELASKSGILATGAGKAPAAEEARTREALKQARKYLGLAETAYKQNPEGSDVAQLSRTAAQIAENARALALGAVGGALIGQLENEVERLQAELTRLQALQALQAANNTITVSERLGASAKVLPGGAGTTAVAGVGAVMKKPLVWFGVAGWGLALLLLFRRRSI